MSFTPALLALGWIGMLTDVQAMAQDAVDVPTASAAEQPASPVPQNGNAVDTSPQKADESPIAETAAATDDSLLIDHSPWDSVGAGSSCAICGGGSGCPPDWYAEEGLRIFGRSRPRGIVLGTDLGGQVPTILLTTRSPNPDVSVAYATTIGHYFARDTSNRDNFVEFSYWGLNAWKDSTQVNGSRITSSGPSGTIDAGSLFTGFFNSKSGKLERGFDGADTQTAFYASYENNFEINGRISPRNRNDRLALQPDGRWQRECQPGQYLSYLYGLRFMKIDEVFRFHSESLLIQDSVPEIDFGDYVIVARNNLLGLQVGADLTFRQCRWAWGVTSKISPCINFCDQVGTITSPDINNRLSATKHEASLIGEVGFTANYRFRPHLMGRASYDFMWITGLALAPEQFQFNSNSSPLVNKINTNGLIFQHGLSLGLEWMW